MAVYQKKSDVLVVGAGHAGCEAALAAARMECSVLLVAIDLDKVAAMPCSPSIGGMAKGQLVKEIDALGGEMAKTTDKTAIQYRTLNTRKGPAVHSSRTQNDKNRYHIIMKSVLEKESNLDLICPNCHSLTSTHKALNYGKGNRERLKHYKLI